MLQNNKEVLVLHYFLTWQNNTVKNIAEHLEIKEIRVHQIINKYLKTKTPK